jgi:ribose/xylose/arabinose/galactoside ABC-type transport system permease subunit
MYIPLLSGREPTNRERRIASLEAIAGFLGVIWLMVGMPLSLAPFVCTLAAILLLMGHGLAILARSNPFQTALWPEFARRMGTGRGQPSLDERDLSIRHRVFVISYQILFLVIFVTILAFDLLLPHITGSATQKWNRLHDLIITLLGLLIPLVGMLPGLVLPWLETDSSEEDGPQRGLSRRPVNKQKGDMDLFPKWVRIISSGWVVWGVCALIILWVFHRAMPR